MECVRGMACLTLHTGRNWFHPCSLLSTNEFAPLSLSTPMSSPNTSSQGRFFLCLPLLDPHVFFFSLSHNHHLTTLLSERPSSHHFHWRTYSSEGFGARARAQALGSPFTTLRSPCRITVAYINPIITNLRVSDPHSIALNFPGWLFFFCGLFSASHFIL